MAAPGGIRGTSASVNRLVPKKLMVTTPNGCGGLVDRHRVGQVDLAELLERQRRLPHVEPDNLGAELGELARDVLTDAGRTSGDDHASAVVAPQLVNLSHASFLVGGRVPARPALS